MTGAALIAKLQAFAKMLDQASPTRIQRAQAVLAAVEFAEMPNCEAIAEPEFWSQVPPQLREAMLRGMGMAIAASLG